MAIFAKLFVEILGDPKLLRAVDDGCREISWLPWLIVFAKQADNDGKLTVNGMAARPSDIARLVPNATAAKVTRALAELETIGVLERDPNDGSVLQFRRWDDRSGSGVSETQGAWRERKRRQRERDKSRDVTTDVTRDTVTAGHGIEQELEQEQEQELDTARDVTSRPARPNPDVDAVIARYLRNHPKRRPSDKDRSAIRRALKAGYTAADLCAAIDGNAVDPWHRQNAKHELTYTLRDNGKIDQFRDIAARPMVDDFGVLTEWGKQVSGGAL